VIYISGTSDIAIVSFQLLKFSENFQGKNEWKYVSFHDELGYFD